LEINDLSGFLRAPKMSAFLAMSVLAVPKKIIKKTNKTAFGTDKPDRITVDKEW